MKLINTRCPNCGGNLEYHIQQGRAICPYCKSQFIIKKTGERWVVDRNAVAQMARQNEKHYKTLLGVLLVIIALIVLLFLCVFRRTEKVEPVVVSPMPVPSAEPVAPAVEEVVVSDRMKAILEAIFHKPYDLVTTEEIAGIQYLALSEDYHYGDEPSEYVIAYSMDDYFMSEDKEQFLNSLNVARCIQEEEASGLFSSDFELFTGLTYIKCNGLDEETLGKMKKIKGIDANFYDLNKLCEYIDSNKIIELKIGNRLQSLEGLSKFSNLQVFGLYNTDISDISLLEQCPKLTELILRDNDKIIDYKVVGKLIALEALELEAEGLKDISFLKALPKLTKLSLSDTIINNLSFLEEHTGLIELCLEDNDKITDLSPIGGLTKLQKLVLDVPTYDMDLACLGKLSSLKKLDIFGAYGEVSFSFMKHLTKLQEVRIASSYLEEGLGVLSNCQSLEKLTLGCISGYDLNFHKLAGLAQLKEIDVSDYDFNADISSLFTLTGLESICLNESSFQADFSKLKDMSHLKCLYLDHVHIYENVEVYTDGFCTSVYYDDLVLQDQIDKIAGCKNLETLSLANNELTDISPLGQLAQLSDLDISHNYIEDITSLKDCKQLTHLSAKDNLIEDWEPVAQVEIDR